MRFLFFLCRILVEVVRWYMYLVSLLFLSVFSTLFESSSEAGFLVGCGGRE